MNRANLCWYALVAAIIVGPAGVRMLCWSKPRPQPIDVSDAEEGRKLFTHEWTVNDPLAGGDGLGPVFNATSCVACHSQGGVGGGGGLENNVTTFISQPNGRGKVKSGVIHKRAISEQFQETLALIDPSLPAIAQPDLFSILPDRPGEDNRRHRKGEVVMNDKNGGKISLPHGVHISQRNTPALFGARLIEELPDRVIIAQERQQKMRWGRDSGTEDVPVGRAMRLRDGKVGKFGWKAQSASLIDFVEAACANELGLGNPGAAQPTPLSAPAFRPRGLDLTTRQCQQITAFISTLPKPVEELPANPRDAERITNGKAMFKQVGCADCHVPDMGSAVGVYSDLLLHKMGRDLEGIGGYNAPPSSPDNPDGTSPDEWRTPPLWGVADSAPYLHDGRAATLEQAITLHGGQATHTVHRYQSLAPRDRNDLVFFLSSLRAPR